MNTLFSGYNSFREVCGLGRVESFDLLVDLIPLKIVERLKLLYAHVDDIDLFVGGISEAAEAESLLGERIIEFKCHLLSSHYCAVSLLHSPQAQHFAALSRINLPDCRLETGECEQHDEQLTVFASRYFYDHGDTNPGRLSPHQLVEIRKSNLARVHCDNGDSIKWMQPLSFRKQSQLWVWCVTLGFTIINSVQKPPRAVRRHHNSQNKSAAMEGGSAAPLPRPHQPEHHSVHSSPQSRAGSRRSSGCGGTIPRSQPR